MADASYTEEAELDSTVFVHSPSILSKLLRIEALILEQTRFHLIHILVHAQHVQHTLLHYVPMVYIHII